MRKQLLTGIGAIALTATVLAGCSESTIEPVEPEKIAVEAEEVEAEEVAVEEEAIEEEPVEEAGVGDTLKFDDLQITVNSVRSSQGEEYMEPEKEFYMVLDVVIENTGSEPYSISSMLNFTAYDADSYAQELAIFADTNGSLDGEIGAGRKMAGEIAFDVNGSEYYEFIFEDPFTNGQAIWRVEQSEIVQ